MSVKVKKTLGLVATAAFGLSLMACGSDVSQTENVDIDVKGNLFVSVRDVNGNVLSAADTTLSVTLLNSTNTKGSLSSDSLGTTKYKDLAVGSYQVLVKKAGYASMVCDASIGLAAEEEVPVANDRTVNVTLHKLGATVNGTVVRNNAANVNGNEVLPAGSAALRLVVGGENDCYYVNSAFAGATDAAGAYKFENLPELAGYTLQPQALTVGSELYTANAISGITGVTGESKKIDQMSYAVDADPFKMISTNKNSVAIDDSIVVNFSKAVDVARIRKGDINVSNNVAIVSSWSNENKTLTVKAATGKWNYRSTFDLHFNVYSVDGVYIGLQSTDNINVSIYTDGDLGPVVGVKAKNQMDTTLDYSSNTVQLTWNKLANASGYEIYRKASTDSSYVLVADLSSINDTNAAVNGNVFSDGKSVQLLVVGYNSVGRSAFAIDSAKSFFDKVKPTQGLFYTTQGTATTTTTVGYSYSDWVFQSVAATVTAGATNLELSQLDKMIINFSEPMDTTAFTVAGNILVTVEGTSNASNLLTFTKAWSDGGRTLTITPYVAAGKSAADVALRVSVSFSGVTDKRGNAMAASSNGVSVLYKQNTPPVAPLI